MNAVSRVLAFWFGEPGSPTYGHYQPFWFQSSPEIDQKIRDQFEELHQQAIRGELAVLQQTPEGSLALILLLDQVTRNMYRGTPQAFAADVQALAIAKEALAHGFDKNLMSIKKMFFYLPFEHSEHLEDQETSVALFEALGDSEVLAYAVQHRDLIVQFGRFPHRNAILGRQSTPAEMAFLETPDAPDFGQTKK